MSAKLFDRKRSLIALIFVVHLAFSYYYIPKYWSALAGFIIILSLSWLAWKKDYLFWTGLQLKYKEMALTLLIAVLFLTGSLLIINRIASENNIGFEWGNRHNFVHTFFYTLNEEIVLGALLLKGIKSWRKKTEDWKVSIVIALLFSLVHFIFFRWVFYNSGNLNILAIATLFLTGVLRNNLILKTGHIGYAWAVHFGWVFPMLGCIYFYESGKNYLTDLESFNLFLGDLRIAATVLLLAAFSFFLPKGKTIFF